MLAMCKLFASGLLAGCVRIDLRGNHFRERDVRLLATAIQEGMAVGKGFQPSDVRMTDMEPRADPRMCTTHRPPERHVAVTIGWPAATNGTAMFD